MLNTNWHELKLWAAVEHVVEGDANAYGNVKRMLTAKLRNFETGIHEGKELIIKAGYFISKEQYDVIAWIYIKLINRM